MSTPPWLTRTIQTSKRAVYQISEDNFKAALGITDPEHVLTVSVSWGDGVTITMASSDKT